MRSIIRNPKPATTKDTVAANLAAELERQRWSGRRAAQALGLTQPYVSRRASGEVELSASDLEMFSRFLNIPISRFFTKLPDQDSNLEPAGSLHAPETRAKEWQKSILDAHNSIRGMSGRSYPRGTSTQYKSQNKA